MKICNSCGQQLADTDAFCAYCGARYVEPNPQMNTDDVPTVAMNDYAQKTTAYQPIDDVPNTTAYNSLNNVPETQAGTSVTYSNSSNNTVGLVNCKNCGNRVDSSYNCCPNCGAFLPKIVADNYQDKRDIYINDISKKAPPKKSNKLPIILGSSIGGSVLLIVAIVLIIFFTTSNGNKVSVTKSSNNNGYSFTFKSEEFTKLYNNTNKKINANQNELFFSYFESSEDISFGVPSRIYTYEDDNIESNLYCFTTETSSDNITSIIYMNDKDSYDTNDDLQLGANAKIYIGMVNTDYGIAECNTLYSKIVNSTTTIYQDEREYKIYYENNLAYMISLEDEYYHTFSIIPMSPEHYISYIDENSVDTSTTEAETENDINSYYSYDESDDEYILPNSDTEYITEDDLYDLTENELMLARNEIYARNGRKFATDYIQNYFDEKSWYDGYIEPDDFKESMLSEIERENIQTIKEYEDTYYPD